MQTAKDLTERKRIIKARLEYRQLRGLTNASLRCAINCHLNFPTKEDCDACQNEACMTAKSQLSDYWKKLDQQK
jgi:hypothetical protein